MNQANNNKNSNHNNNNNNNNNNNRTAATAHSMDDHNNGDASKVQPVFKIASSLLRPGITLPLTARAGDGDGGGGLKKAGGRSKSPGRKTPMAQPQQQQQHSAVGALTKVLLEIEAVCLDPEVFGHTLLTSRLETLGGGQSDDGESGRWTAKWRRRVADACNAVAADQWHSPQTSGWCVQANQYKDQVKAFVKLVLELEDSLVRVGVVVNDSWRKDDGIGNSRDSSSSLSVSVSGDAISGRRQYWRETCVACSTISQVAVTVGQMQEEAIDWDLVLPYLFLAPPPARPSARPIRVA
jgi:hypothetical protein